MFQVTERASWNTNRRDARVAFSPDGRFLAVTSYHGVHLHDAETLSEMLVIPTEGRPRGQSFSADGAMLGAGSSHSADGARLWQVSDGELVASFRIDRVFSLDKNNREQVQAVALSPDGEVLAAGTYHGQVVLLQLPDGEVVRALGEEHKPVIGVAFSPTGAMVASATSKG